MLIVATCLAFGNSFAGTFVLDDEGFLRDEAVRNADWGLLLSDLDSERRPVSRFTFALNHAFGGVDPWGYHLLNLAVHLATGLLLFELIRTTLARSDQLDRTPAPEMVAGWATLLWLVHPLQVQSVTYISQRSESLCALFYVAVPLCIALADRRPGVSRVCWSTTAVLACWLGAGCKQVMVTAPVTLLLYDGVFLSSGCVAALRRRWPVYLAMLPVITWLVWSPVVQPVLASVTTRAVSEPEPQSPEDASKTPKADGKDTSRPRQDAADRTSAGFGMKLVTPLEYLRSQPGVVLFYLRLAFWPNRLSIDWFRPIAEDPVEIAVTSTIVVAMLLAVAIGLWRRTAAGFLGAAFFLILLPTSSILPIKDLAVHHRAYLALAPITIAVVVLGFRATGRLAGEGRSRILFATAVLASVVVVLIVRTRAENEPYRSYLDFWRHNAAVCPENPRAFANLALGEEQIYRQDAAIAAHSRAAELMARPDLRRLLHPLDIALGHTNFSVTLQNAGSFEAAEQQARLAIEAAPEFGKGWHDLGTSLCGQGRFAESEDAFRSVTELQPRNWKAFVDWGTARGVQGNHEGAAELFREAVRLNPGSLTARFNLAQSSLELGQPAAAAAQFRRLLKRFEPSSAEATRIRRWLQEYQRTGEQPEWRD